MSLKLKTIVVIIRLVSQLILVRDFGSIIHDIESNSKGLVTIQQLRRLEKLSIKRDKANLDINFLLNCKRLGVTPKFIFFRLPNVNSHDAVSFRKKLLKNAISKRIKEKKKLDDDVDDLSSDCWRTRVPHVRIP